MTERPDGLVRPGRRALALLGRRRAAGRDAALAEAKYRSDQARVADTDRVARWLFVGVNDF